MKVGKIYSALRKRFNRTFRGRYFVVTRNNRNFLIDAYDYVSRQIEMNGVYEREQVDFFLDAMRERSCTAFIDVGANLGQYSILAASDPDIEIHSFEPDLRIGHHLAANLFINKLDDRIHLHPYSLSNSDGSAKFHRHSDQNRGRSGLDESGQFIVETRKLDSVFDWRGRAIAMKVDIEGHELAFIEGAREFLLGNQCICQIEVLDQLAVVEQTMNDLGYSRFHSIGNDHYFENGSSAK